VVFTIKKGHHQDTRPFSSWLHFGRKSMAYYVTFGENCAYQLPDYNSLDVNKLFGLSFGLFAVHENSARFGWRWNEKEQCIDLLAYCYVDGKLNWDAQMNFPVVGQARLGEKVECSLSASEHQGDASYHFEVRRIHIWYGMPSTLVRGPESIPSYGLTHSLYFGGRFAAPHDMHIKMAKA
jgi:hypothetical protein